MPERNLAVDMDSNQSKKQPDQITIPEQKPMKMATHIILLSAGLVVACPAASWSPFQAAGMRDVDLRSFFHGDPPAPPKAPPPKQVATVATAPDVIADAQIESFMRAFAEAIKAREGKPLLASLSDKYAIDDLPQGRKASDFLLQAIDSMPGATEIIIKSVERKNDMRIAKVEFKYNADNIKLKTFRFDVAGKLLWSDLFVLKRQVHGA